MSSVGLKVRDACQNCHRRKIRCIVPAGNSACHNCAASSSPCLFAPRAKAGRPRRTDSDNAKTSRRNSAVDTGNGSPQSIQAPSHSRSSIHDPINFPASSLPDESHFGMMSMDSCWRSTPDFPDIQEYNELGFPTQSPPQAPSAQHNSPLLCMKSDVFNHDGFGLLIPPNTMIAAPTYFDHFDFPDERLNFEIILKLCADLDQRCRFLRDNRHRVQDMSVILSLIESACSTASFSVLSLSVINRASTASVAMIQGALHKCFELCEGFDSDAMHRAVTDETEKFEHLVSLKRMDLSLLQARFSLNRMNQPEAAETASQIHRWIVSVLKQQQYESIW